jgi:hypothetical protein
MLKTMKKATSSQLKRTITLQIHCLQPPDPLEYKAEFGLQRKASGNWVICPGLRDNHGDYLFECQCTVKLQDGQLDFSGPFVHGKPGERFLYLSWKPKSWDATTPQRNDVYIRRMKIHLKTITPSLIEHASVLQATVAGKARDGGPACASVPLLDGGWQPKLA